jgi:hypothetical protein
VIIKCGYIHYNYLIHPPLLLSSNYTLRLVPILLIPYSSSIYSYNTHITAQYNDPAHRRKGEPPLRIEYNRQLTRDSYESVLSLISLSGKGMDLGMDEQLVNILTSSD